MRGLSARLCFRICKRAGFLMQPLDLEKYFHLSSSGNFMEIIIIIIIIIIITLFQEDNIFGRVASLTYGPQLTNVDMIL